MVIPVGSLALNCQTPLSTYRQRRRTLVSEPGRSDVALLVDVMQFNGLLGHGDIGVIVASHVSLAMDRSRSVDSAFHRVWFNCLALPNLAANPETTRLVVAEHRGQLESRLHVLCTDKTSVIRRHDAEIGRAHV